jgi:hypothetical protein
MADDPKDEKERSEILKDMDATLKRMLNSPPKPHKVMSHPRSKKSVDRRDSPKVPKR